MCENYQLLTIIITSPILNYIIIQCCKLKKNIRAEKPRYTAYVWLLNIQTPEPICIISGTIQRRFILNIPVDSIFINFKKKQWRQQPRFRFRQLQLEFQRKLLSRTTWIGCWKQRQQQFIERLKDTEHPRSAWTARQQTLCLLYRPIRTTRTYGSYTRAVFTARVYGCFFRHP